ncbi:C39 family peptidase [Nicoliella lavandulae]|uniref:C39 family peptidase n=1 Tax=Nicoliella lavandulae TaxID=3082954 RepID=A0ABU8SN44_9LACO
MKKSILAALLVTPAAILTIASTQTTYAKADDNQTISSSTNNTSSVASSSAATSQSASNSSSATSAVSASSNVDSSTSASSATQSQSTSNASSAQSNSSSASTTPSSATSSNATSSSQSSSSSKPINHKPAHKYNRVTKSKSVNYDTMVKKSTKLYKGGAYNTKPSNVKSHNTSTSLKHKWVHVTSLQTTKTGTYAHIFHNGKDKGWINQNAFDDSAFKLNNVPLIGQRPQLPTGCEITAVTMMVNYATHKKYTKTFLANKMPRSSNPNKGFVGSPYSKAGWYIYPPALMKLVRHYTGSSVNLTGKSTNYIKNYVQKHQKPVVVYVANVDGFPNHALTVTGFTKDRILYNDPWINKRTSMKINDMNVHRSHDGMRAISY